MKSLRVFAIGGWLSYRALFSWLQPSLFVMVRLIPSVTQMIFFVFLGRAASVENDTFFIVGNALVAAAVPCLFAMSQTIAEERFTLTLPALSSRPPIASPCSSAARFRGPQRCDRGRVRARRRSLHLRDPPRPLRGTGCGALDRHRRVLVHRHRAAQRLARPPLAPDGGALELHPLLPAPLRGRQRAARPPARWLQTLSKGLPITHGAEAAREVVAGSSIADVAGLPGAQALVGTIYAVIGLVLLRRFEVIARRHATLEVA